jgi:hypothetical protein
MLAREDRYRKRPRHRKNGTVLLWIIIERQGEEKEEVHQEKQEEIEKLEAVDNMSDDKIRNAWSDWYDKLDDEFLELRKSDVSQMAFWAGVKAAQHRVQRTANTCRYCGSSENLSSVCEKCLA